MTHYMLLSLNMIVKGVKGVMGFTLNLKGILKYREVGLVLFQSIQMDVHLKQLRKLLN